MNFLAMQNFVLSDRFSPGKRGEAKVWINSRYGRLWAQEPWSFKLGFADFTLGANDQSVSLGSLQRVHSFTDKTLSPSYSRMTPIRPEDYHDLITGTSGVPGDFTIVNNIIYFDRPAGSARIYTALGS